MNGTGTERGCAPGRDLTDSRCAAAPTTQKPAGPGHNGGPKLQLFGLGAAWLRWANEMELRRLAKLHVRIEMKKRALQAATHERQRIMNRCIRRMRRARGLN